MKNQKSILSPILALLVTGSTIIAIIDQDNRAAYLDISKVAVGYAFGCLNSSNVTKEEDDDGNDDNNIKRKLRKLFRRR